VIAPLLAAARSPHHGGFLNPYLQSVLLGIVEGLTEFLPVSSTAHLRITEALMKIPLDDAYWKMYTIVIQLGAIFALTLLFLAASSNSCAPFRAGEWRPQLAHPPHFAHPHSIRLHLRAFASFAQMERPAPGQYHRHGSRAAHRRHRHVGDRLLGRSPRPRRHRHRANDTVPGRLDRHLPNPFRRLSRNLPLHVDHRRRSACLARSPHRAGLQFPALHSHHVRRHLLGPAKGDSSSKAAVAAGTAHMSS